MIITLSVSVELTYLHILGGRLHSTRKQCTLQVLFGHTIRCVQIEILFKRHSLSTTFCIVSCILDSWVAYGLVILFHSFYAYYYFQFWTPKLIIYEFCVQEGPTHTIDIWLSNRNQISISKMYLVYSNRYYGTKI